MSSRAALNDAIRKLQSQAAFAQLCGVTQPAVSGWAKKGELPAEHVLAVEAATGISRHELRPDIYPAEPAPAHAARDLGAMAPAR